MIRRILFFSLIAVSLLAFAQATESYQDLMKQGDQLSEARKYQEALERFRGAVGRTGGDKNRTAFASFKVAATYEKLGDPATALDWYQTSEASAPFDETEAAIKRLQTVLSGRMATAEEIKRGLLGTGRSQRVTPSLNIYVHFDTDQDTLTSEGEAQVAELAAALNDAVFARDRFNIVGHTDKRGSDKHNQDLSERRARKVCDVLHDRFGFDKARFEVVGMGKRQLLRTGDTEEDHQVNRRVEIKKLSPRES